MNGLVRLSPPAPLVLACQHDASFWPKSNACSFSSLARNQELINLSKFSISPRCRNFNSFASLQVGRVENKSRSLISSFPRLVRYRGQGRSTPGKEGWTLGREAYERGASTGAHSNIEGVNGSLAVGLGVVQYLELGSSLTGWSLCHVLPRHYIGTSQI